MLASQAMDGVDIPWIEQPRELTTEMLQAVPVKGRHSKKEKDDERKAEVSHRTSKTQPVLYHCCNSTIKYSMVYTVTLTGGCV